MRGKLFLEGYIRGLRRPPGGRGAGAPGRVAATVPPVPGTLGLRAGLRPLLRGSPSRRRSDPVRIRGTGGRGDRSGGAVPGAGLGCLLREQRVERRRSRREQVALCTRPSCQAWGRRAARERPGSGQRHVPQTKAQKPRPNSPQGAETKYQRRKCLTMAENKGELHGEPACARPRRRTLSPPRSARLSARRRSLSALWFL